MLRVQGQERRRGETAWARHLNSQTSWTVRPASPQEGSAGGSGLAFSSTLFIGFLGLSFTE